MRISTVDRANSQMKSDHSRTRSLQRYPSKVLATQKILDERDSRRRREQQYQQIEERKFAPLEFNDFEWQQERCLKAISLDPSVQELVSKIEEIATTVVETEEKRFDERIRQVGLEYEEVRQKLDQDIETLKELEISVTGERYELTRLSPTNSNLARPEKVTDFLGDNFTIADGESIRLNSDILSNKGYYEDKYLATKPDELERAFERINSKMGRYQALAKYLGFLLRTKAYIKLQEDYETIKKAYVESQTRKRQMETYQLIDQKKFYAIASYLVNLDRLKYASKKINELFEDKSCLQYLGEEGIFNLAIKEVMSMEEYSELIAQVRDYINRVCSNDEETMAAAYELVKGEYPIVIPKKFIYDMLISTLRENVKEDNRGLSFSNPKK